MVDPAPARPVAAPAPTDAPADPAPPRPEPPALRADLFPSIESCCEDSCCYLDWMRDRPEPRD